MAHQYAGATTPPGSPSEASALLPGTLTPRGQAQQRLRRGGGGGEDGGGAHGATVGRKEAAGLGRGGASSCLSWSWCVWENVVTPVIGLLTVSTLIGLLTGGWWMGKAEHRPYVLPLLLLSVLPSFVILVAVYAWRYRSAAPMPLVVAVYLFGIFAAAPVALLESYVADAVFPEKPLDAMDVVRPAYELILFSAGNAFLVAALFEEAFKVAFTSWRADDKSSGRFLTSYGIVVVGISTALGFATLENATYVLSQHSRLEHAFLTAAGRAGLSVPLHAVTGALVGWGVARRHRARPATPLGPASVDGKADRARDPPHIMTVFLLPWFIHGLFDFSLMVGPALEPHLTKSQYDGVIKAGVAVAVLVVGASAAIAIWFVGDLAYFSTKEHPREDAAEWPSIEAFEQGIGCASGREKDQSDVPVWR